MVAFPGVGTFGGMTPAASSTSHAGLLAMLVCLKAATDARAPVVEVPNMRITREGIYSAGQPFDAYQRIVQIINEAQTSLLLIDGYINGKLLEYFYGKGPSVTVTILTKKASGKGQLVAAKRTFNQQYRNTLEIPIAEAFHDRFASLKDAGKYGFMFSRIEEQAVITPSGTPPQLKSREPPSCASTASSRGPRRRPCVRWPGPAARTVSGAPAGPLPRR